MREAPGADEMIAMIRAAAQTWMDANPRLRLVYDGVTTEEPANGNNVIGWGSSPQNTGIANASAHHTPSQYGPTYTGFHVIMENMTGWSWQPCDPENGPPCSDDPNASGDFQGTVTHELGHVLGLNHACWEGTCNPEELSMSVRGAERSRQTLALGDVLGVRELYPTDAAMPTIHRP